MQSAAQTAQHGERLYYIEMLDFNTQWYKTPPVQTGRTDERDWRRSMCMLLNLPENAGLCRLVDLLEDDNGIYVVMERVVGVDLFELQDSNQKKHHPSGSA